MYDIGKVNPYSNEPTNKISSPDDFVSDMGYMLLGAILGIACTVVYYQIVRLRQRYITARNSNPHSLNFFENPNNYV